MHEIKNPTRTVKPLKIQSYSMSQEAIKIIKAEAERLDRSASWVMNDLALKLGGSK